MLKRHRYTAFFLILILVSVVFSGCAQTTKTDWESQVIYFIMTDRFYNGDTTNDMDANPSDPKAYHGGDLQGIIDKLDYIKDLGATAIWITPVVDNEEGGYHGYWAYDFERVDEHLGDTAKLKELTDKAHDKDIKVILDMVFNHTGYNSPWLSDPAKSDWFNEKMDIVNYNNQEEVEKGWLSGLPDLNQSNPDVEKYLIDMAMSWIDETGIDGFRLDTVRHVPKEFWTKLSQTIKQKYPDFFLLGEVWVNDPEQCYRV
ncbi:alpha-amylase family glycosyl hydrolase [Mahella sp.]|uniref:alpha-amylase family glycosyl hydrolase n=1 Tax=Mahella sp. TaxID=2798721 RepID=UPI0025C670B0|nr:alpha-amylase family glycosyl hydrolase [Mahella sp.]MBZ4665961.1 alpha-amlyase [Mahella sp.]